MRLNPGSPKFCMPSPLISSQMKSPIIPVAPGVAVSVGELVGVADNEEVGVVVIVEVVVEDGVND